MPSSNQINNVDSEHTEQKLQAIQKTAQDSWRFEHLKLVKSCYKFSFFKMFLLMLVFIFICTWLSSLKVKWLLIKKDIKDVFKNMGFNFVTLSFFFW